MCAYVHVCEPQYGICWSTCCSLGICTLAKKYSREDKKVKLYPWEPCKKSLKFSMEWQWTVSKYLKICCVKGGFYGMHLKNGQIWVYVHWVKFVHCGGENKVSPLNSKLMHHRARTYTCTQLPDKYQYF